MKLSVAEISNSLPAWRRETEKDILIVRYIYRAFGNYIAWALIRLGIPCKMVVAMGVLIGVIGCGLIAFGSYWIIVVGCLLILVRAWLDYADGTVARATHTTDKEGAYFDLVGDNLLDVLFPISVGLCTGMLEWGLVLAVLHTWSNLTLQDGKTVFGEDGDVYRTEGFSLWKLVFLFGTNIQAMFYPALLVAVMFGRVDIYLYMFKIGRAHV